MAAITNPPQGRPALNPVAELALDVLRLQRDVLGEMGEESRPLKASVVQGRLAAGNPALGFEDLHIDPKKYHDVWTRSVDLCAARGALTSDESAALLSEGEPPDMLMRLTQPWYEHGADDSISFRSDLTPEMISISVKPWLLAAATRIASQLETTAWTLPYCPACGGEPDLAVIHRDGRRSLLCSRCDTIWQWKHVGCPFCEYDNPRIEYHQGSTPGYALQECKGCQRALKTVDASALGEDLTPAAERLFAADLDHLAAQLNLAT